MRQVTGNQTPVLAMENGGALKTQHFAAGITEALEQHKKHANPCECPQAGAVQMQESDTPARLPGNERNPLCAMVAFHCKPSSGFEKSTCVSRPGAPRASTSRALR